MILKSDIGKNTRLCKQNQKQHQHYRTSETNKYKICIDKLSKYEMGKYKYLSILKRVASIGIYYWNFVENIMEI